MQKKMIILLTAVFFTLACNYHQHDKIAGNQSSLSNGSTTSELTEEEEECPCHK